MNANSVCWTKRWIVAALVLLVWPMLAVGHAGAVQLLGYAQETRTVISWRVSEENVEQVLPDGWRLRQQDRGPHRGANFFLVLADQVHFEDVTPVNSSISDVRAAVWTSPAERDGASGFMVLGGMITPKAAPGDYGVFQPATVLVNRSTENSGGETLTHEEWEVRDGNTEVMRIRLTYSSETPRRVRERTRTFSRIDPDIQRLYEYNEDEIVLYSRSGNIERLVDLQVDADGSPLADYLEGSPELVAVVAHPWLRFEASRP